VLTVPILKVGQDLTAEVKRGDAEREGVHQLAHGRELRERHRLHRRLLPAGPLRGDQGRRRTSPSATRFPSLGALRRQEWVGQPFSEYPEAEEKFKAAVNAKEREWGNGPQISTTHNFTGYAIVEGLTRRTRSLVPVACRSSAPTFRPRRRSSVEAHASPAGLLGSGVRPDDRSEAVRSPRVLHRSGQGRVARPPTRRS
jgi:hypothetical protein